MRPLTLSATLVMATVMASCSSGTAQHATTPQIFHDREGDFLWSGHASGHELGSGGELQIFIDHETHPHANASFAKYTLGVGGGLPLHSHEKTEEYAYIISGVGAAMALDENGEVYDIALHPGYMWYNPPGVWHAVRNTGDVPFVLVFATVPNEEKGLLAFFREISSAPGEDPKPLTMEEFRRLGEEYDLILPTEDE